MRQRVSTVARVCGHNFMIFPGDLKRGRDKFCSRKCFFESRRGVPFHWGATSTSFKKGHKPSINAHKFKSGDKHWLYGKHWTLEMRKKLSLAHLGIDSQKWFGFTTPERKRAMQHRLYKEWRKSVFERDDYTCKECGLRGVELHADHIKPWAFFDKLRYDINNGRTLCVDCHRETDTWGYRAINKGVFYV